MTFRGWPIEALEFFEGLAADNSKTYWLAHKDVYEDKVRAPLVELLAELEPRFGPTKIFRPYRDVRFSKDKSPYKTEIAALVGEGYVQLSTDGLGVGFGTWMMAGDQLTRYREAVDDDASGEELTRLLAQLAKKDIAIGGQDKLKRVPRGYPNDHPRAELLRHKGLAAFRRWPVAPWLSTAAVKKPGRGLPPRHRATRRVARPASRSVHIGASPLTGRLEPADRPPAR